MSGAHDNCFNVIVVCMYHSMSKMVCGKIQYIPRIPENSCSKICGQFIAHCFIYCMLKLCLCVCVHTHTDKYEYTCVMVLVWGSEDNFRSQISLHCRFQRLNSDLQTAATSNCTCWAITVVRKLLLLAYLIYNVCVNMNLKRSFFSLK